MGNFRHQNLIKKGVHMECPDCEKPLTLRKIGQVFVDECPHCHGIWFDKKALQEAQDEIDPDLRWMDLRIWSQQARFDVTQQPHACSKCKKVALHRIAYQEPGVEVLYCSFCQGAWLNAGDLGKIIDALRKEADTRSAPEYVKDSLREAFEVITRPRNFVSE